MWNRKKINRLIDENEFFRNRFMQIDREIGQLNKEINKLKNPPIVKVGAKLSIKDKHEDIEIGEYVLAEIVDGDRVFPFMKPYLEYIFVNIDTGKRVVLQDRNIQEFFNDENA